MALVVAVGEADEMYIMDVFRPINSSFPSTHSLMDASRERRSAQVAIGFYTVLRTLAKLHDVASYL